MLVPPAVKITALILPMVREGYAALSGTSWRHHSSLMHSPAQILTQGRLTNKQLTNMVKHLPGIVNLHPDKPNLPEVVNLPQINLIGGLQL